MNTLVGISFVLAVGFLITLIVQSWRDRRKRNTDADGSGSVFLCDSGGDCGADGGGGGD